MTHIIALNMRYVNPALIFLKKMIGVVNSAVTLTKEGIYGRLKATK